MISMSITPPSPETLTALREAIRAEALRAGFSRAGFTSAEPLAELHQRRWERWRAEGRAGVMTYLMRETPRRTHPRDLMPEAQTALVTMAAYYAGDHPAPPGGEGAAGKVARYAWGRDYHEVLRDKLGALGEWIANRAREAGIEEPVAWRACVDSAPLDERALAVRAGLGFIGKNTLLLDPGHGSWALIGVLLISLALPPDPPLAAPGLHGCGGCQRCLDACPTGALEGPWRMDPRRCTSYLTIEQKDEIPPELNEKREGWAFGCDICQEVCPFNAAPLNRIIPELGEKEGAGPWLSERRLEEVPSGKAFLRAWGHTPLARPGWKRVLASVRKLKNREPNLEKP